MISLVLGVLLWGIMHFLPAADAAIRRNLISRIGENPYKGLFTLAMAVAIYLMISGWKSTIPEAVYLPPVWGRHVTLLLMLVGFVLFFAPYPPNNIKRLLRHPQLTGVVCWGFGHLLANGELRSIVLFGGMTTWAVLEILLLNRRDGARSRPDRVPFKNDLALIIGGGVVYFVVLFSHAWLFGVSPIPG
jgi:uncharacterized membrane protein